MTSSNAAICDVPLANGRAVRYILSMTAKIGQLVLPKVQVTNLIREVKQQRTSLSDARAKAADAPEASEHWQKYDAASIRHTPFLRFAEGLKGNVAGGTSAVLNETIDFEVPSDARLMVAGRADREGRYEAGLAALEGLRPEDPAYAQGLNRRGLIYHHMTRDLRLQGTKDGPKSPLDTAVTWEAKATDAFQGSIEAGYPAARYNLAVSMMAAGDTVMATEQLQLLLTDLMPQLRQHPDSKQLNRFLRLLASDSELPARQTTSRVLGGRPIETNRLNYNPQTASDNTFMNDVGEDEANADAALAEWDALFGELENVGLTVQLAARNPSANTPDGVFVNNTYSVVDGMLTLYPMRNQSRQNELQDKTIDRLMLQQPNVVDLRHFENIVHFNNRDLTGIERVRVSDDPTTWALKQTGNDAIADASGRPVNIDGFIENGRLLDGIQLDNYRVKGKDGAYLEGVMVGRAFEGTGSLALDRVNRIAYFTPSVRTDPVVARAWAEQSGYTLVEFDASMPNSHTIGAAASVKEIASQLGVTVEDLVRYNEDRFPEISADSKLQAGSKLRNPGERLPIYHTNVMSYVGTNVAVIAPDTIADPAQREATLNAMGETHDVLELSIAQIEAFGGNIMELDGHMVMSTSAYNSLTQEQRDFFTDHDLKIVHSPYGVTQRVGGGGVRCVIGEIADLVDLNNFRARHGMPTLNPSTDLEWKSAEVQAGILNAALGEDPGMVWDGMQTLTDAEVSTLEKNILAVGNELATENDELQRDFLLKTTELLELLEATPNLKNATLLGDLRRKFSD